MKRQDIANASMCSMAKVNKDIQRGILDEDDLCSVSAYVIIGRLSSGGLDSVNGLCMQPGVGAGMRAVGFTPSYDDGQDQG